MRRFIVLGLSLWLLLGGDDLSAEAPFIILVGGKDGEVKVLDGDPALKDKLYTPASTYKVVVALAGMKEGLVDPFTSYEVNERHIKGSPRLLTLSQALQLSSNQYFLWLGDQIGKEKVLSYTREFGFCKMAKEEGWIGTDPRSIARGFELKTTPTEQHQFMHKVVSGALTGGDSKLQKKLEQAILWPGHADGFDVHAKSGTWGGAAWMVGFVKKKKTGSYRVITVLSEYKVPNWKGAKSLSRKLFDSAMEKAWE